MVVAMEWRGGLRCGFTLSKVPASDVGEGGAGDMVGVVVVELPQRRLLPGILTFAC